VKSWLSQREFESDYGFATDGIRWIFIRYDADSYTHNVISEIDLRPVFLTLYENATTGAASPTDAVSEGDRARCDAHPDLRVRQLPLDRRRRTSGHQEKQEAITDEFYDDYIKYVFGVAGGEDERRAVVGR